MGRFVDENLVAYGDWTTLAFDGLVEVLENDGLTPQNMKRRPDWLNPDSSAKPVTGFRNALADATMIG